MKGTKQKRTVRKLVNLTRTEWSVLRSKFGKEFSDSEVIRQSMGL